MKSNFCPASFSAVLIPARDMAPLEGYFSSYPYPETDPPPWSHRIRHIRLAGKCSAPYRMKLVSVFGLIMEAFPRSFSRQ